MKSEVGRGSTFTVCLPLGVRPADTTAFEVDAFLEPVTPPERGRILVVDDEPYVRAVISRMLRNEHDVVVAASGREGQDILESDQLFDLIICDLMMPAVSGINLFEWLSSAHPELVARMVFVTGGAFTPKTRDFLNKIDNPCLEKPFEADALCRLVSERMAVQ